MTDAEIAMAAAADPDQPAITQDFARGAARLGLERTLRLKLALTREAFAQRYHLPLDVLEKWERGSSVPTPIETTYLNLIAADPDGIADLVAKRSAAQAAE